MWDADVEEAMGTDPRAPGFGGTTDGGRRNSGDEAAPGTSQTGEVTCPVCHGAGQTGGHACSNCGGTGRVVRIVGDA